MQIFCDDLRTFDKKNSRGSTSRNFLYRDVVHQHDFNEKISADSNEYILISTYSFPNIKQYATQTLKK